MIPAGQAKLVYHELALRDFLPYNYIARRQQSVPVDRNQSGAAHQKAGENEDRRSAGKSSFAALGGRTLQRNSGIPLDLSWVQEVRVNTSAVERRAQTQVARRTVKKDWQAAWLLRAITCMDLTTLSGDDTEERVRRLCAKARQPIQQELVHKLEIEELDVKVAAVCVYHLFVETALHALEGSDVHVASVSTGFPAGLSPLAERVAEIRRSAEAGAHEIDVVITRAHVFGGRWQALYDEIAAFKQACGAAHMKVILATGDLLTLRNVARASVVVMMAGADFIKTSTGKEPTNATLPVGLVMARAIREYAERTGMTVGFKAAGGIRTAKQSTDWLAMMKEELGEPWIHAELFRFGASGLLGDIERQLEHHATGRYSAEYRHPLA
jgi:deoxyribose-phosphate aldolase